MAKRKLPAALKAHEFGKGGKKPSMGKGKGKTISDPSGDDKIVKGKLIDPSHDDKIKKLKTSKKIPAIKGKKVAMPKVKAATIMAVKAGKDANRRPRNKGRS